MFKNIINNFKTFDTITNKILKHGLKFCFIITLISCIDLLTYIFYLESPFIYYIGINLFRLSLIFSTEFIICSFVATNVKNELL